MRKYCFGVACLIGLHASMEARGQAPPPPTRWTEAQVLARFDAATPELDELRLREKLAQAEVAARAVYQNPAVSYSREGAGFNEFFEVSQTLPLSGTVRRLSAASAAAAASAGAAREVVLRTLRNEVRLAFYRMIAAQERAEALLASAKDIEKLVAILAKREQEGEGSRYDRLRAERELIELRAEGVASQAAIAAASGRLAALLPTDAVVQTAQGVLNANPVLPPLDRLVERALAGARPELRFEARNMERYQAEERVALRLRIPEPQISAGLKRAENPVAGSNLITNSNQAGFVFGLSVPLQIFNDGRREVARYRVEQEQVRARIARLQHQIQAEVRAAARELEIRRQGLSRYQTESLASTNELSRIARVAYDEGEVGILELLDSLRVQRATRLRLLDFETSVREALIELEHAVGEEIKTEEIAK